MADDYLNSLKRIEQIVSNRKPRYNRRSKYDIHRDILLLLLRHPKGLRKTQLLQKANLNYKRLWAHIKELVKYEYITKRPNGFYVIHKKGIDYFIAVAIVTRYNHKEELKEDGEKEKAETNA